MLHHLVFVYSRLWCSASNKKRKSIKINLLLDFSRWSKWPFYMFFARLIQIQSFLQNGEIYCFCFFLLSLSYRNIKANSPPILGGVRGGNFYLLFLLLCPFVLTQKDQKIKNKRCFHARNCEYLVLLIVYTEPLLYRKFYLSLFTVSAFAGPPFVRAYAHVA